MATNKDTVSRRGFIGAIGAVAAVTALPPIAVATPGAPSATTGPTRLLDAVRAWYAAEVNKIVRAWEPRFRFRQYRRTDEGSGDYEAHESPQEELEEALRARLPLRDDATALLALAASPHRDEVTNSDNSIELDYVIAGAMARDVLARAERLGYFAKPCREALRFPDLPLLGDHGDDLIHAELEVRNAEWIDGRGDLRRLSPGLPEEWYAQQETRLERARAHLAAIHAGTIPAITEAQKLERHLAERRSILLAYRTRLSAAGRDPSWVDVDHPCYASRRLQDLTEDEAQS